VGLTLGYVELDKGSIVPLHQHPHEQITYIIEGRLDMVIDGKSYTLTDGMHFVIPGQVPHSAIAITRCKVIDAFHPTREDYRV
jgi:quercetin dioxygenase-like cupin family protein